MANTKGKPTAERKPASAKKNTSKKAPERDEYAYYDDLYEKKPRKKKVQEPIEEEEDLYSYNDDLYKKKAKKRKLPEPIEEEKDIPPASTQDSGWHCAFWHRRCQSRYYVPDSLPEVLYPDLLHTLDREVCRRNLRQNDRDWLWRRSW